LSIGKPQGRTKFIREPASLRHRLMSS
jgi:hypothetical protein